MSSSIGPIEYHSCCRNRKRKGGILQIAKQILHKIARSWIGIPNKESIDIQPDVDIFHIGRRSYSRRIIVNAQPYVKKTFARTKAGRACFRNEMLANRLFPEYPWMPTSYSYGRRWHMRSLYPSNTRLDILARTLKQSQRSQLAVQALEILLDLYVAGWAHRDFHAGNLYYVDGQLRLVDFETMIQYPSGPLPPFVDSYDISGNGLKSPYYTKHMGFVTKHKMSVSEVLQVSVDSTMQRLKIAQKDNLLEENVKLASGTFATLGSQRHVCEVDRIYSSFSLPGFTVESNDSQRNSAMRFEQFNVTESDIEGKRLLDLGSNIGGMLFEAQKFKPSKSMGIEYDIDKVAAARRVAVLCDLNNVQFVCGDIDKITVQNIGGPYDVVMCLAVDTHVKKQQRLYRLLSQLTQELLLFEGNSSTDYRSVQRALLRAGFRNVQYLGVCHDDCVPQNNSRPVLVARK